MNRLTLKMFLIIALMCLFGFTACTTSYNDNNTTDSCEFENPLTDLPWLKAKVYELTLLFEGNPLRIAIYQCTYSDGKICFLEDRGNVRFFYDCQGKGLCTEGGHAGVICPEELKIDYINKKLIWESK